MDRPVSNLSLALTYAVAGLEPRAYRVGNALLHWASAWLLFAVVRRSLRGPRAPARLRGAARGVALAGALLWAVHPLCSDVVLYAAQRTEACLGFFYLLTAFLAVRRFEAGPRGRGARPWAAAAVAASALGMASKELMATAPVLLLLFDRAFWSGSFGAALRRHGGLHAGLFATLAVFAALQFPDPRGRAAYFWEPAYLLAQGEVVLHYLGLAVWPRALVFDYGPLVPGQAQLGAPALLLAGAVALAAALSFLAPRLGFAGAWVFGLLAPTSSLIAMPPEVGAERRMYLALAGLAVYAAVGTQALLAEAIARGAMRARRARALGALLLLLCAGGLGLRTRQRAADWQSERTLWETSAAARPGNPRAHLKVGDALRDDGDLAAAAGAYRRALALWETADAHNNLAGVLARRGDPAGALRHLERAAHIDPRDPDVRANLELLRELAPKSPQ